MRLTRSASVASSFNARPGLRLTRRWTSPASSATALQGSIASAVAERRLAAEHRQLAEQRAAAQLGERDHAAVLVLAGEHDCAGAQQVAGVARVPLPEDHLAALPVARHRDLRERQQLALLEPREHLGAGEQAGGLLPVGHVRIMTAWQSHVKS